MSRNKDLNVDKNAINLISKDQMLRIYEKAITLRIMEEYFIRLFNEGKIKNSLYLSTGQECATAALSESLKGYQVFAQHRSGDTFLNFGGAIESFRDEMLEKKTGCSEGKGGHFGVQWHDNNLDMYGDNLLIGECVPRAVGAALGNRKKTLCIFGDGAAEEDYVLESLGFAATHKLPIVFVCTDNDLAILSHINERRTWSMIDVAKSFGLKTFEVSDDPWTIMAFLNSNDLEQPLFMNIHVCRKYWHVGTGIDGPTEWDRFLIIKEQLTSLGLSKELESIDRRVTELLKEVWKNEVV